MEISLDSMVIYDDFIEIFMVIYGDFIGFYGDLWRFISLDSMVIYGDFIGFYGDL